MRATTPGVSPRATASLSWRDNAALPAPENSCACACSAVRGGCALVWARPVEAAQAARAANTATVRAALCNLIAVRVYTRRDDRSEATARPAREIETSGEAA